MCYQLIVGLGFEEFYINKTSFIINSPNDLHHDNFYQFQVLWQFVY
jgi:hypothetical protein